MMQLRETNAELGGAIDLLLKQHHGGGQEGGGPAEEQIELVLLLGARANSAAPLSSSCWSHLRGELLERLRAAVAPESGGHIDGVLLAMHGNMCVGNVEREEMDLDPEGTLARDCRLVVGQDTTVVMTLDLHANVTPCMVQHLNGAISYDHYPHDDIFRTGQKAAWLLLRAARGEVRPMLACSKINMMQAALQCSTIPRRSRGKTDSDDLGVGADLMLTAKAHESAACWSHPFLDPWENEWFRSNRHYGREVATSITPRALSGGNQVDAVLSANLNWVHPHNDFPEMGNAATVTYDDRVMGAREIAAQLADTLVLDLWARRDELHIETFSVAQAVEMGRQIPGVVLLLELADCAGGGAAADSIALVRELLAMEETPPVHEPCISMCVDPSVAAQAVSAGEGAVIQVALGHRLDPKWGQPLQITTRVVRTTTAPEGEEHGRFVYSGGPFGGTEAIMGPSAVLAIVSDHDGSPSAYNIQVLVMSQATYDWADEQYCSMGLDPARAKFVGIVLLIIIETPRHKYHDRNSGLTEIYNIYILRYRY
jgi:microcystin degradation protein MlrC